MPLQRNLHYDDNKNNFKNKLKELMKKDVPPTAKEVGYESEVV